MTSVIFSQPQIMPSPYLCFPRVHTRVHIPTLLGITFILAKSRWSNYTRSQEVFPGVKPRRGTAQPAYSLVLRFCCKTPIPRARSGPLFRWIVVVAEISWLGCPVLSYHASALVHNFHPALPLAAQLGCLQLPARCCPDRVMDAAFSPMQSLH